MAHKMTTIAIIPARGGSKGIPRKNLMSLAGRPLIAYAIEAALTAQSVDKVIVSTDDKEIAEVSKKLGAEVPFLRPTELSDDNAPMLGVLCHALQWCEQTDAVDALVLLQPTSPLRTHTHIDEAVALFFKHTPSSVVSVMNVPHQYNPFSVMTLENNQLRPFMADGSSFVRRQDKPRVYARNGPAVLVCDPKTLKSGKLYGAHCVPYLMDEHASLDIDTPSDIDYAQWLLTRKSDAS